MAYAQKGLITLEEIKDIFAISNKYGQTSRPGPHRAILLYRSMGEWKRIDNGPYKEHPEFIMCDKELKVKGRTYIERYELILNCSPCAGCCDKLIYMTKQLNCEIKISFSNFYRSYNVQNLIWLSTLLDNGIALNVFDENDWKFLFKMANLDYNNLLIDERKESQEMDELILAAVSKFSQIRKRLNPYDKRLSDARILLEQIGKAESQEKVKCDLLNLDIIKSSLAGNY